MNIYAGTWSNIIGIYQGYVRYLDVMGKAVGQQGQMKSNLNKTEFKKRLTEIASAEKEFYLIPYNFSGTPFCGTYDDSKFELTRNSLFIHVKAITIKGEYKELGNSSTKVLYTVGWTK